MAAVRPRGARREKARQLAGQVGEGDFLGDERVEPVVGEERERLVDAPAVVPARAARGRDLADLRRDSLSRRAWKSRPRGAGTMRSPYQLISTTVASVPAQASAQARPAALALAWKTTSASPGASSGFAKRGAQGCATVSRRDEVDVDDRDLGPGQPRGEARDEAADDARADDQDPVARPGAGIPERVERRLHVGREHRAPGRHGVGNRRTTTRGATNRS